MYRVRQEMSGGLRLVDGVGCWEVTARRYRFSFWGNKNVLKLIVLMAVLLGAYTTSH